MRATDTTSPILLVGPSWVGDMVMAASLVAALRQRFPDRPVDVLAPPASLPIASLIEGVRNTIPLGFGHGQFGLVGRWRIGRSLKTAGHGTAIVLPRAFKAAIPPFAARIPERVGYAAEGRSILLTDARNDSDRKTARTIDRFVALAGPAGQPPASPRPRLQQPKLDLAALAARFGLNDDRPVLGLCPGAEYGPAKQWPAAKFAALARLADESGYRVRLFGGPKDKAISAEIVRLAGVPIDDVSGRTSLIEAAALLGRCDAVVSNDSGLMHVAGALDRPLVVVYGSSSEKMTPPTAPNAEIVSIELSCRPCFKRECPLGTLACLEGIDARRVFDAVERVIAVARAEAGSSIQA
ncbi:lipopolysaccharide heptosyltransferase II [Kaistia terrae]|uniref:lipopolysaccharide heptosyltransferase II n=1 Tax=Kaistia terrae TaxID=537017 RepID=A0ABW0PRY8_9HYPH|nr:lipopolysaccharide heptosyltransferase II [Kaistia terrae]MCX5577570.1 lipopolysaccharide heptosyltransferase II [Kaistia terrae]